TLVALLDYFFALFLLFFDYNTPLEKIKRPQGISFPEPLEPPPAEIEWRCPYLFRSAIGYTI
ncbi:hypothetical protein, partial [Enterococcus faecium]|uniref:hypothetical protein n=1 Tax=Enterococcus faecium TaxID=1352 RepID=UPI003CE59BBA